MSFFNELKRRNVIRVGIAYVIVAWLVLQFADVVLNNIEAPHWVFQVIMLVLGIGLPVVLVFAWAFEMTPEGIKKEKDVDRSQSITTNTGHKLDRTIIVVLVIALAYFIWQSRTQEPPVVPTQNAAVPTQNSVIPAQERHAGPRSGTGTSMSPDNVPAETPAIQVQTSNSIAVLPFVNMSDDDANEYFSDGISEELLNLLTKIPEIKVAARTSSFQFKGKTGDIETIAAQLKVANVLEGSVRKAGNQVRITAQLIKADDGYHLWSETYDRQLDNIFAVQDEIAAAVVEALKVTLLGAAAPVAREADPEAYTLFLKGRYLYNQGSEENFAKAATAYQGAIDLDPAYAPAWAGLSQATLIRAGQDMIELDAGVKKAREAAEHAVTLDPELAFGWVSLSRIQGQYDWNWTAANESMQKALQLEPNASDVMSGVAGLASSLGQLDQSVTYHRQASALDPLNQPALDELSNALGASGQLDEALEVIRRLYALNPDYFLVHTSLSWLLLRQGLAEQALLEAELESTGFWRLYMKSLALFSLDKHAEADAELAALEEKFHRYGAYQIAEAHAWRNEPDAAFKWLDQAIAQRDPGIGNLLQDYRLRSLYGDPRWPGLLKKAGLLDAWNKMPAKYKGAVQ